MSQDTRNYVAEFIGAFALTFIGAGSIVANAVANGAVGLVGVALAHGFILALSINALGHVSGAHFNPAITIAMLATGRIGAGAALGYVVAQLLGASVAGFLLNAIFPAQAVQAAKLGATLLAPGVGIAAGVALEAVLTFFLVLSVFGTAVDPRGPKGVAGFGIGLVLLADILAGGPLTGASMNPSRSFGPALASGNWDGHLVYWIGPILGALIAAFAYDGIFLRGQGEGGAAAPQKG